MTSYDGSCYASESTPFADTKQGMVDMLGTDMHGMDHARVIQEFINTKEWRNKLAPQLQPHIINDLVCD